MSIRTIGLTQEKLVEIITAYSASNQQIDAVAATPGWFVIGAFFLPATVTECQLEALGLVSIDTAEMHVRLYDTVDVGPILGSVITINETHNVRKTSSVFELVGARLYQIQVEVIGVVGVDFGVIHTAAPIG